MRDIAALGLKERSIGLDCDRLAGLPHLQREIERHRLAGVHGEAGSSEFLESRGGHGHAVRSRWQPGNGIGAGLGGYGWVWRVGVDVPHFHVGPGDDRARWIGNDSCNRTRAGLSEQHG